MGRHEAVVRTGVPFTIYDNTRGTGPTEFVLRTSGGRADGSIPFSQVDLRLAKDFTLSKERRINAFAECINLFTARNFGKPNELVSPPRSFQFGMGYTF
jgi:hypothetical protein